MGGARHNFQDGVVKLLVLSDHSPRSKHIQFICNMKQVVMKHVIYHVKKNAKNSLFQSFI